MIRRFWFRIIAALFVEVSEDNPAGLSRLDHLDGVGSGR